MNVDPIARWYRWFEYAAFGRKLELARNTYLQQARSARHVLLAGDGDGRFLEALLDSNPDCEIDSIDLSRKMLRLTAQRIGDCGRVRLIQDDIRTHNLPQAHYDLIATHFFLDCFDTAEAAGVIAHLAGAATNDATWIVSEFRIPESGIARYWAAFWIRASYLFFRLTTGLQTKSLPQYAQALQAHGFHRADSRYIGHGLLVAELWHRRT